jgi:glycosyltransferase involved in cell wall biosynthesis
VISVVIPIFATAVDDIDLFRETVVSVQAQSVKAQLIVVDDGSRREFGAQIEEALKAYPGSSYIRVPRLGAPAARNIGFKCSDQPFLFFCDADVVLYSGCLQKMVTALNSFSGASYAYCDFRLTGRLSRYVKSRDFDSRALKQTNYISTMSLIRRPDFIPWDESLLRFQDHAMWLNMANHGKKGIYLNAVLFSSHVSGKGISSQGGVDLQIKVLKKYAVE